jgi:hypothetical protein
MVNHLCIEYQRQWLAVLVPLAVSCSCWRPGFERAVVWVAQLGLACNCYQDLLLTSCS